jgi:hypothetical protein
MRAGSERIAVTGTSEIQRRLWSNSRGEKQMPDDSEILLQEIAIVRQEIADVRGALENLDQLVRELNVTLMQCVEQLTTLTQNMRSPLSN